MRLVDYEKREELICIVDITSTTQQNTNNNHNNSQHNFNTQHNDNYNQQQQSPQIIHRPNLINIASGVYFDPLDGGIRGVDDQTGGNKSLACLLTRINDIMSTMSVKVDIGGEQKIITGLFSINFRFSKLFYLCVINFYVFVSQLNTALKSSTM